VHQRRSRYETGLQKLLAAEAEVANMKQELIELQPKLIQTQKEVRGGAAPRINCCHTLALLAAMRLRCSVPRQRGQLWCLPAALQVAETLVVVNEETREAEAKKLVVQGEEAAANEKAAAAKAIKVGASGGGSRHCSWGGNSCWPGGNDAVQQWSRLPHVLQSPPRCRTSARASWRWRCRCSSPP
jgi:hypothetical protein